MPVKLTRQPNNKTHKPLNATAMPSQARLTQFNSPATITPPHLPPPHLIAESIPANSNMANGRSPILIHLLHQDRRTANPLLNKLCPSYSSQLSHKSAVTPGDPFLFDTCNRILLRPHIGRAKPSLTLR